MVWPSLTVAAPSSCTWSDRPSAAKVHKGASPKRFFTSGGNIAEQTLSTEGLPPEGCTSCAGWLKESSSTVKPWMNSAPVSTKSVKVTVVVVAVTLEVVDTVELVLTFTVLVEDISPLLVLVSLFLS